MKLENEEHIDKEKITKKPYRSPELIMYGTISQFTQSMGTGTVMDNPGSDPSKSMA